jgi:DNA repair exonuclease SbcCD ATPase subunit
MMTNHQVSGGYEIQIEGIGGIDSTTVTLREGVNLLEGRNATNRTSFLQAIMAAMGSEDVSLKADRDEGFVELSLDGERYTRTLERSGEQIVFGGQPYLSDPTEANLFSFLLETNEVRQAVKSGGDLREVVMRPVDTANIEAQIRSLQTERREVDERIESLETERERLPKLEEKRTDIRAQLSETRTELERAREQLDDADSTVENQQEEKQRLEETLEELAKARSELDSTNYRLETKREALASAKEELEDAQQRRSELADSTGQRLATLEDQIQQLREKKRTCDGRISKLNRIIQFNEEMLEGDGEFAGLFEDDGEVTDGLLGDEQATCWTCGSEVATADIESMLDRLRELSHSQRQERNQLDDRLDELTEERKTLENERDEREQGVELIADLEAEIDRRSEAITDLEADREQLQERISELEARAESLEDAAESRVLELHKTVNEKEVEIDQLETELEDVTAEIEELEEHAEEIEQLKENREQIGEQLTELRTRIERLEADVIEAFNEHMETLVDLLEYQNLARVWIERQGGVQSGGNTATDSSFELHIVRTTEDGTTYEDALEHLSESEREVIGIVFALAGYLVHEVYETQPFLLLDSLEAIDAERIALLIEYLADYAPTIVVALLTEDTRLLDESYPRIKDI